MDELSHRNELGNGEAEFDHLGVVELRSERRYGTGPTHSWIGVHSLGVSHSSPFALCEFGTVDRSGQRELGSRFVEMWATGPVTESAVQSIVAGV